MRNRILCLFTMDTAEGVKIHRKVEIYLPHFFYHVYFSNLKVPNIFDYPRLSQFISLRLDQRNGRNDF
jgi:hypothetical protein